MTHDHHKDDNGVVFIKCHTF